MIIPIGIEGDYLETKNTHLYFDIKGLHHPNNRKICFIRFFPDNQGDRQKNGVLYKKIYVLEKRYSLLKTNYPQYLFFSKEYDMELQGVKSEDIERIYTPRTYFQSLYNAKALSKIEKVSRDLCELFIDEGGISRDCIGITGSQMVGLNKNDSDIDLIIYGTKLGLDFQHSIKQIFKTSDKCRSYNVEEYKKHYDWRFGGSNIPFSTFLKTEMRKLHQGKYQGIDFFIRYIKSPDDWKGDYYDYQFQNLGRIHMKAKIIDSIDSIFTPCRYKIKPLKVLYSSIVKRKLAFDKINEIFSYRGRFCEQAIEGETVNIEAKLEKVKYRNEQEYFRLVLENQISDKMMVIT
ncbi:MAG: hypothetical protein P8Y23_07655 [Candidatus Lokiarchaeota archaeon]|jgi:predicted nucleotidyltransferase